MIISRGVSRRPFVPVLAAICFVAGASVLRVAISGPHVAASIPGALIFSAVLLAGTAAAQKVRPRVSTTSIGIGLLGGLVLLAMPLLHSAGPLRIAEPTQGLVVWSLVVTVVACSEELVVRGLLFNVVRAAWGTASAVVIAAVVFAIIHLPLYGWRALPLDLIVGIWLGVLRCYGGVGASATAHTVADLGAGWLL